MKWFKHYSNASDSNSLNLIIDELGLSGVAYYWLMVELLAERFNGDSTHFEISLTQFLRKLRIKNRRTLVKVCQNFTESLQIKIEITEKFVLIDYPKLLEIRDNYSKNLQVTSKSLTRKFPLDKDKEKDKEKDKDILMSSQENSAEQKIYNLVFDLWNKTVEGKLPKAKVLSTSRKNAIKRIIKAHGELKHPESWVTYFEIILKSDFLLGGGNTGWKANFDWVVKSNSYVKTLEGFYNSSSKKDSLSQTINLIQNNPYENGGNA